MDLTGKHFGKLTVVKPVLRNSWLCKCECGNTIIVPASKLLNKHTRSCGCLFHNSTQKAVETKRKNKKRLLEKQIRSMVLNPEPTFKNKTSKRKGVCYSKNHNRYMAYINVSGKRLHLGVFKHQEDAILARKEAEELYYGRK